MRYSHHTALRQRVSGFTLIEMVIVVGIMLIMVSLTVVAYNSTSTLDSIRAGARQVQSAVGGARDRQFKVAADPDPTKRAGRRGLRLLVDATDPTTVTSMVFVGIDELWSEGQIAIGRFDLAPVDNKADDDRVRVLRGWPKKNTDGSISITGWKNLYDQGLLVNGSRIRIPKGNAGTWYTVQTNYPGYELANYAGKGPEILVLTSEFQSSISDGRDLSGMIMPSSGANSKPGADSNDETNNFLAMQDDDYDGTIDNPEEAYSPGSDDYTDYNACASVTSFGTPRYEYELELKPTVLPNQEPLRLPAGVAIDLLYSKIPRAWYRNASLPKGSSPPATDYDENSNYNGWGVWSVEATDGNNPGNDIYRQYSPRMDIMFSPQGSIIGPSASQGMIHLRLANTQDIGELRDPANPQASPMLYSSIFTQSGYVATFQVDITDNYQNGTIPPVGPPDGFADDPLSLARKGGTAGR